jgi:hypothetical protein
MDAVKRRRARARCRLSLTSAESPNRRIAESIVRTQNALVNVIDGHKYQVSSLALVNDTVWSGSADGTVMINDAAVRVRRHGTQTALG